MVIVGQTLQVLRVQKGRTERVKNGMGRLQEKGRRLLHILQCPSVEERFKKWEMECNPRASGRKSIGPFG